MKLKINESKTLEFEMDTSGCSWKELEGHLRLTLENVEYGFPATIDEGVVRVDIPVFKDILNEGIKSSLYKHKEVTVKARLDLIANNEAYVSPWNGEIDIEIPVSVKVTEEKEVKSKTDVKVVDPEIKEYLDEEKKAKRKKKLLENLDSVEIDEKKKTKEEEKVEEKQAVKDKEVRKVKKSKFAKTLA